jgi:hypothetical protein
MENIRMQTTNVDSDMLCKMIRSLPENKYELVFKLIKPYQ